MKCRDAEISILLQDSGELSKSEVGDLSAHLAECGSCRQFRQIMVESAKAVGAGIEPPVKAVHDVMRTARVCAPIRKRVSLLVLRPVMGMAASFLVIMALLFGNFRPDTVGLELVVSDTQMMDPEDQVVSIMYDGLSEDDLAFNFLMTYEGDAEG